MPDIYIYFGLTFYFRSNEHPPVHVHIKKGGREVKAEFTIKNSIVVDIEYKKVVGKELLTPADMKLAEEFLNVKKDIIKQRWIDFFVNNKRFKAITITKRIKL
jgi:hypothetical protein